MATENEDKGAKFLTIILMFIAGFVGFTLLGFVVLIILLSVGILPTV